MIKKKKTNWILAEIRKWAMQNWAINIIGEIWSLLYITITNDDSYKLIKRPPTQRVVLRMFVVYFGCANLSTVQI
jgi:hypothetical protein